MDLTTEDLLCINRLLLELYRPVTQEEQIQVMLRVINEVAPSDLTAWNEFNMSTREIRLVTHPPLGPEFGQQVQAACAYAHQSPFPPYFSASGDRSWRMITDFMPIEEFQKTNFCQQALLDIGAHQISSVLNVFADRVDALTLNRLQKPYSERDRAALNVLYPHLCLSRYNANAFEKAHQSISQLQAVVETAPAGYAYVGAGQKVEWVTAKAKDILRRFYPKEPRNELDIPLPVATWLNECLVRASHEEWREAETQLCVNGEAETLEIRLVPSQLGGWTLALEAHPAFKRPHFRPLPQFSDRKNEVLRWMVAGKRNAEIAAILYLSPRTVEKHVAEILTGLEAENRATAIVRAMEFCAQASQSVGGRSTD